MMYYVGMEIRQPISTDAQTEAGYHALLGSRGEGKNQQKKTPANNTPQPSTLSLHRDHYNGHGEGRERCSGDG